jgi:hypothetical protein
MDYSHLRAQYENETTICLKTIERLRQEKEEAIARMTKVRNEYFRAIENLGLKEGAKVRVDFPEDKYRPASSIYGYIESIKIFIDVRGFLELTVTLPGRGGKRLKTVKPHSNSYYSGIKPEWVTILPDDFSEPPF